MFKPIYVDVYFKSKKEKKAKTNKVQPPAPSSSEDSRQIILGKLLITFSRKIYLKNAFESSSYHALKT